LQSSIQVDALSVDSALLKDARSVIVSKAEKLEKSKLIASSALNGLLTDAWAKIPAGTPRPILSPVNS
jgi:hypothetical protein